MSPDRRPSLPMSLAATVIALSGMNTASSPSVRPFNYMIPPEHAIQFLRQERGAPEIVYESQADKYQPRGPYFIFIAYPWAQNERVDGKWRYWNDNGGNPPRTWINNVMPMFDENGSLDPEDNLYSGNDPRTWEWYMKLGMRAKVPIFAFTNWGPGSRTDDTTRKIFEYMASPQNPFKLARATIYGELMSDPNRTPEVWEFVEYMENYVSYANKNHFAWRDQDDWKLIIPFYTRDEHDTTALKRLAEAARITGVHAPIRPFSFFNEKIFLDGGLDPEDEPYGLVPYAPANADVQVERNGMTGRMISAGFDPSFPNDPRVLERDPEEFESLIIDLALDPADMNAFVLDEAGENSGLAPAYYGVNFTPQGPVIDPSKNWGYTYIDLLGKYLPDLPILVPDLPGNGFEYQATAIKSRETVIVTFPSS